MRLNAPAFLALTTLADACRTVPPRPAACPGPEPSATSSWTLAKGTTGLEARLVEPARQEPVRGALGLQQLDGRGSLGRLANSTGRAVFDTVPAGRYIVHAFAVGFKDRTDTLILVSGQRWIGEIRLPPRRVRLNDECGWLPGPGP